MNEKYDLKNQEADFHMTINSHWPKTFTSTISAPKRIIFHSFQACKYSGGSILFFSSINVFTFGIHGLPLSLTLHGKRHHGLFWRKRDCSKS